MIKSIIHTISIWIIIIPFLIGIMNYKGLNRDSKWIFFLVIIGLLPQVLTAVLIKEGRLLNITYNLYTPIEFLIIYILFVSKYCNAFSRILSRLILALYILICLFFFLQYGITKSFLSGLVCINNIIYMIWILLLLKQEYNNDNRIIIKTSPFTWFLIAFIVYAPCTLLDFALYNYMRHEKTGTLMGLWVIHSACNILMYLFFSIGLLIRKQVH